MSHFRKLGHLDVSAAAAQLDAHPELWDAITWRREGAGCPHRETQDIWLRNLARDEIEASPRRIIEPHLPVFYPAWGELTELHDIVYNTMTRNRATFLGHILITRIPEGGQVYPHSDRGWHAEACNLKVWIPLRAPAGCVNTCEDEQVVMREGEVFSFNNQLKHSVVNLGPGERRTLIISMATT
jgi:hypothetical protein